MVDTIAPEWPDDKERNWGPEARAAITTIVSAVNTLIGLTNGRLSEAELINLIIANAPGGGAPEEHTHPISDIIDLQDALDGKADSEHSHAIGDVTGLQTALDGKSGTGHGHVISDVASLQATLAGKAASSHTHAIADVTGLQEELNILAWDLMGKAQIGHTHSIANVTGLQTALDTKLTYEEISYSDWAELEEPDENKLYIFTS